MSSVLSEDEVSYENDENLVESQDSMENVTSIPKHIQQNKLAKLFHQNSPENQSLNKVPNSTPRKEKESCEFEKENSCLRCGSNPQFICRNSGKTGISVFGTSIRLDRKILEELGSLLSNKALKKESEAEYFSEMNIFDQEWEFPFNKKHFEFEQQMENEDNNPDHIQIELFKRSLIDLQMKLRNLSDFFIKVDRERLFFRKKLISVLETKVKKITNLTPELKKIVSSFTQIDSKSQEKEIEKLRKENKESQSLFVNLKRRNIVLEEEVKQLKKKLKEKRSQLKKYMFRKETLGEDMNRTQATTNSNNQGFSGEGSYMSKEGLSKFSVNQRHSKPMSNKLKFSSTILTNRQKQENKRQNFKNSSYLQPGSMRRNVPPTMNNRDEYFENSSDFTEGGRSKFQKNFGEKKERHHERPSISTLEGEIEIPEMLLNLQNGRGSRISGIEGKRNSEFKFMNDLGKNKNKPNNLSSKLQKIKKRNSKFIAEQNNKNPFMSKKVYFNIS